MRHQKTSSRGWPRDTLCKPTFDLARAKPCRRRTGEAGLKNDQEGSTDSMRHGKVVQYVSTIVFGERPSAQHLPRRPQNAQPVDHRRSLRPPTRYITLLSHHLRSRMLRCSNSSSSNLHPLLSYLNNHYSRHSLINHLHSTVTPISTHIITTRAIPHSDLSPVNNHKTSLPQLIKHNRRSQEGGLQMRKMTQTMGTHGRLHSIFSRPSTLETSQRHLAQDSLRPMRPTQQMILTLSSLHSQMQLRQQNSSNHARRSQTTNAHRYKRSLRSLRRSSLRSLRQKRMMMNLFCPPRRKLRLPSRNHSLWSPFRQRRLPHNLHNPSPLQRLPPRLHSLLLNMRLPHVLPRNLLSPRHRRSQPTLAHILCWTSTRSPRCSPRTLPWPQGLRAVHRLKWKWRTATRMTMTWRMWWYPHYRLLDGTLCGHDSYVSFCFVLYFFGCQWFGVDDRSSFCL